MQLSCWNGFWPPHEEGGTCCSFNVVFAHANDTLLHSVIHNYYVKNNYIAIWTTPGSPHCFVVLCNSYIVCKKNWPGAGSKKCVIRNTSQGNNGDKWRLEDFCGSLELRIFIIGTWEAQLPCWKPCLIFMGLDAAMEDSPELPRARNGVRGNIMLHL